MGNIWQLREAKRKFNELIERVLSDDAQIIIRRGKNTVEGNNLILHSPGHPRQGWSARFAAMHKQGEDRMLFETTFTQWDDEEWSW